MKIKFLNDYSEGCHPSILKRLEKENLTQQVGYGDDDYSKSAISKIQAECQNPHLDIHFVSGGTLANLLVISSLLKPYESVISAESGHINTHEAGAIEATGHKIEYVKTADGKLTKENIAEILVKFPKYHTVKPRLVYISNSTEFGTVYTKTELEDLYAFCKKSELLLFIDGARLPMALCSTAGSMSLADISQNCDVFYIGGTKCGALLGEAVVLCNEELQLDFKYNVKQRGALLAKGRLIGTMFDSLFTDNLIFELAHHANAMASKIEHAFINSGVKFLCETQSNQIFPILSNQAILELKENYDFFEWQKIDLDHTAIRLVTSWATEEVKVEAFIAKIKDILK